MFVRNVSPEDMNYTYECGERPVGIYRRRWEVNVKMYLGTRGCGMDLIYLAQDMDALGTCEHNWKILKYLSNWWLQKESVHWWDR
jgi:hypothetical protein